MAWSPVLSFAVVLLAAAFYSRMFHWYGWSSLLFPTLLTLAPPLIFALGSGWALGRLQPRLLYVWMLAPFICSALPLPEALGLWDGSFFTEYPLTLGKLDPAFSAPAVVVLAQCISLAAGVVLLAFQFERIGRICKGKTPS